MDYRKFLSKAEEVVLPYFGGARVEDRQRTLRLAEPLATEGWQRFVVQGRTATATGAAEPPSLDDLPAVRGHLLGSHLVREGAIAELVHFLPEEEPPRFAPATARRWPGGELIFGQLEFEGDAEEAVRRALEDEGPLAEVKGTPATLRGAYGYAVLESASRRMRVPISFAESRPHVLRSAQEGRAGAEAVLRALADEREQTLREIEEQHRRLLAARAREVREAQRVAVAQVRAELEGQVEAQRGRRHEAMHQLGDRASGVASQRARLALEDAGARVHSTRALNRDQLEVTYTFMGERFLSIVDPATLQVIDSGICLGHPPSDKLVTLDSLPSVIKEAIETGRLVKLRHP